MHLLINGYYTETTTKSFQVTSQSIRHMGGSHLAFSSSERKLLFSLCCYCFIRIFSILVLFWFSKITYNVAYIEVCKCIVPRHGFLLRFKCNSCVGFIVFWFVEVFLFGYLQHLVLQLSVLFILYC